ncbi:MAG: hypothetical protein JNK15_10155 [Planctomycetes bacterium]|nr:hypothetical protein [Planctomycetota bacterium]
MFRKSFQILVVTGLVALAAIVAYATLRFAGPEEALQRAEAMFARGDHANAVAELELAATARSMQADVSKLERLLRLRYRANSALGNTSGALRDVEALVDLGKTDVDLLQDRIRLRALERDVDGALLAARQYLERHPGNGRVLELAGEAAQAGYQPLLRELDDRIRHDLPRHRREAARSGFWAHVYRRDGDPEVTASLQRLAGFYAETPTAATAWPKVEADLVRLRGQVQQALDWFARSLACGDKPVAAFRAEALALGLAERIDDLLVACEIHRRRFQHPYVDEAGVAAAYAQLRDGALAATIATAERWLPPGTVGKRLDALPDGTAVADLLLARSVAAFALADSKFLQRAWQDVSVFNDRKLWNVPALLATSGMQQLRSKDLARAEKSFASAVTALAKVPLPIDRFDVLPELARLHLDLLRQRAAGEAEIEAALQAWRTARPESTAPLFAQVDVLRERGKAGAALRTIDDALAVDPTSAELFTARLDLLRLHAKNQGQDGPALVATCLRLRITRPEVTDPALWLLCAESALQQKLLPIAEDCTRAAVAAFPQHRLPRLLEIRHALAAGRADDARQKADRLLELLPPDGETLDLALQAYLAAGADPRPLLPLALARSSGSAWLRGELLRCALARGPGQAAAFATPATRDPNGPPELRVLAATATAVAGDATASAALLDPILARDQLPDALDPSLGQSVVAWLLACAATGPDDSSLQRQAQDRLLALSRHTAPPAAALFAAARELAPAHPHTAATAYEVALAFAAPAERNGTTMVEAARLALRLGNLTQAEERCTAALAFADGRAAAVDLARLCLATGRNERAAQVAALIETPTDAAMALHFGALDIAANLVAANLVADPADLVPHCLLASLGQPAMTDWAPATGEALAERLRLLCTLGEAGLGPVAVPLAQAMATKDPNGQTTRLLLARALGDAGRPAEAAAIHRELFAAGLRTPVFLRELARLGQRSGQVLDAETKLVLMDACTHDLIGKSPLTFAFGMNLIEDGFRRGGHPAHADQVRLALWQVAPPDRPMGAADLLFLRAHLPPMATFQRLDQALAAGVATPRSAAFVALAELGREAIAADAMTAPAVLAAVVRALGPNGGHGALVHFVLDHEAKLPAPLTAPERRALLRRHLEAVGRGEDDATFVPRTMAALVQSDGSLQAAATLHDLLQEHPTALALHVARAALAAGTPQARTAVAELRAILAHADAPATVLDLLVIAGESRALAVDDAARLQALPKELLDSPLGRYARGLLALRQGRPDDALADLAVAAPRPDGMHLFALALAALQGKAADGPARARAAFEQLVRDYPSSSLARNAGSFKDQLAPR